MILLNTHKITLITTGLILSSLCLLSFTKPDEHYQSRTARYTIKSKFSLQTILSKTHKTNLILSSLRLLSLNYLSQSAKYTIISKFPLLKTLLNTHKTTLIFSSLRLPTFTKPDENYQPQSAKYITISKFSLPNFKQPTMPLLMIQSNTQKLQSTPKSKPMFSIPTPPSYHSNPKTPKSTKLKHGFHQFHQFRKKSIK